MTFPSHIAVGYILAEGFLKAHLIPPNLVPYVYGVSIVSANFPDMDAVLFKKIYDHRTNSPFHYPFTWWLIYLTVFVSIVIANLQSLLPFVYLSILTLVSHFLMDTFGVNAGIRWFAPFHKKEYSFLRMEKRPDDVREWVLRYVKHPIMIVEVLLCLSGILLYFFRGV